MNEPDEKIDYKALIRQSKTIGEMLNVGREERLRRTLAKFNATPEQTEIIVYPTIRFFKPWPEWVLRVATEVYSVNFPTINKKTLFECFKFIHWLILEAEILSDTLKMPDFKFPTDVKDELFRLIGHGQKHMVLLDSRIAEVDASIFSPESQIELQSLKAEIKESKTDFSDIFFGLLKRLPLETQVAAYELIAAASQSTLDKEGRRRETTATPIYEKLLESWMEVELLSGPAELCELLDPVLKGGDCVSKLDRVKKIVNRIGIEFAPKLSRDKPKRALSL